MRKWQFKLLGAAAIVAAAAPALAQEGVIGPGSRSGLQPDSSPTYYRHDYRGGFAPFDAAADVAGGALNAAGEIVTAPVRAMGGTDSYAMMPDGSYCAQRYRSYDPASGTFLGFDGRRHPCD